MSIIHKDFAVAGVDVSHWQGTIDWTRLAKYATFAIIRSGDSIAGGKLDKQWETNWNAAKDKVHRGSYWFYRTNVDPKLQAAWAISSFTGANNDIGELGFYIDLELNDGRLGRADHSKHLAVFMNEMDNYLASITSGPTAMTGIYTSSGYWNSKLDPMLVPRLNDRLLWVAQWPFNISARPGYLPTGWDHWDFWQFSAKGDGKLMLGPGGSHGLDLNVFNGSFDLFKSTFGIGDNAPPPPVDNRVVKAFRPLNKMNIRNIPTEIGVGSKVLAKTTGEVLPVIASTTDERGRVWYKIAGNDTAEMWISSTVGEPIYA